MTSNKNIQDEKDVTGIPFSLIIAMILAIAIVIFAIQNSTDVALKLYAWQIEIPLSLLLFVTLGIGVFMAILISIPGWRRKRKLINQLKRNLKELKAKEAPKEPKLNA